MKEKPQGRLQGTWMGLIAKSRPGVIASNWLFQGMRYMNWYEVSFKIFLDVLLMLFLISAFGWWENMAGIIASFLIAHTMNWILNGHIFVLLRYVWPVPKTKNEFEKYVRELADSGENSKHIDGIAIFGSYCRGQLHEYSDLDARVIVGPGLVNGFLGAIFCTVERTKAFFKAFPLDIYCCIEFRSLDRLREDEVPIILIDKSGKLSERYSVQGTRDQP